MGLVPVHRRAVTRMTIEKDAIPAPLPEGDMPMAIVPPSGSYSKRATKEWFGKRPESMPPPSVKRRILERENWLCYKTKVSLRDRTDFDFDHIIALCNGGENREANIAPILRIAHREKTKKDVAERVVVDNIINAHYRLENKQKIPQRPKHAKPKRDQLPLPPRRPLYIDIEGTDA
jgi:5-methylcytosine-specific restriction endonuclease McrA